MPLLAAPRGTDGPVLARARGRRLAAVLAATLALTGVGVVADGPAGRIAAVADERGTLQEQRDAQEAARNDLGTRLDGVSSDLGNTYLALADARARLPVAEAELAAAELRVTQITERLGLAEAEHASLGSEIAQGAQNIDATRSSIGSLARSAYRGDGLPNTLALVTGAASSEQFLDQAMASSAAARSQQDSLTLLEMDVALNRNTLNRYLMALRQRMAKDMSGAQGLPKGEILGKGQEIGREQGLFLQGPANALAGHARRQIKTFAGFKHHPCAQGGLFAAPKRYGHTQAGTPEILGKFRRQSVAQGGVGWTQKSDAGVHVGQS